MLTGCDHSTKMRKMAVQLQRIKNRIRHCNKKLPMGMKGAAKVRKENAVSVITREPEEISSLETMLISN